MITKSFTHLKMLIDYFYNPLNFGIVVLRDRAIQARVIHLYEKVRHKEFVLKDDQHINNGQLHYLFYLEEREVDPGLLGILELYKEIRKPFGAYPHPTQLDYGVTEFPPSDEGAKLHRDFSYNVQLVVTIVFGPCEFVVANDREGTMTKRYMLEPGDILFMRAPRNRLQEEKENRPIHGMGKIPKKIHTLEIREVDLVRKDEIKRLYVSTSLQQPSRLPNR